MSASVIAPLMVTPLASIESSIIAPTILGLTKEDVAMPDLSTISSLESGGGRFTVAPMEVSLPLDEAFVLEMIALP